MRAIKTESGGAQKKEPQHNAIQELRMLRNNAQRDLAKLRKDGAPQSQIDGKLSVIRSISERIKKHQKISPPIGHDLLPSDKLA